MKTPITFEVKSWIAALVGCAAANLAVAQLNCPNLSEEKSSEVSVAPSLLEKSALPVNFLTFDPQSAADLVAGASKLLALHRSAAGETGTTLLAPAERMPSSLRSPSPLIATLLPWSAGVSENSPFCSSATARMPVRIVTLHRKTKTVKAPDLDFAFPATLSSATLEKSARIELAAIAYEAAR